MKRLITSSIIIILILVAGGLSLWYLQDTKEKTVEYIQAAQDAIDNQDKEKALESTNNLKEFWGEREEYLTLAIRYHDADELTKYVYELPSFIEYEDYSECAAILSKIKLIAEHIIETETPTLLQIF